MRKQRPSPAPIVRVTAIGKCEVALGRSRVRPEASVFFALLLYLGMKAGSRIPRGELLELLWTDAPDAARRHALRQMVYRLRRAGLDIEADGSELVIDAGRVACDLARVCTDEWVAGVALDDIPSPAAVLPSYQHALTRPYTEWVDSIRATADAHIRRAALRHAEAASREGRWNDVERAARLALAADSLNEAATLALAEATAMGGSKAEALRVLDAYLWEVGERDSAVGVPARLLRRRIADLPSFRIPRAADPPLIARSRELAWLNGQLELAAQGNAVTAMLVGAPGIGKTAVAHTFMAHAEMRGWRPVTSRQQPSDVDRPMSIFVELLPALLKAEGALGAAPESIAQLRRLIEHRTEEDILSGKSQEAEAVQARIRSSLHDLLSAVTHEGPLICLLEDLHWIDNQSLKVLTWLVEHAPNLPVLWLLTARLESRFADLRTGFPDDRTPSLMIEPLDREGAATLFKSVASGANTADAASVEAVAERAYSVTGGNPLFVREVAWHWTETGSAEALPTNLRALMRGRVSRLSPAAQRVLHCCAVLGRYATVPRVATVLEISTAELLSCIEEVDALGISGLGGEPGSLVLHDLWQEELASGLRPAPRALLHLRCGDVLYAEGTDSKQASVVTEAARHLVLAGARAKALRALDEAAAHHRANGMNEDAIGALDTAIGLCDDDRDKLRLHERRVESLRELGGWPEIRKVLGWALAAERELSPTKSEHTALELTDVEATLVTDSNPTETMARAARCVNSSRADDIHRASASRIGARAAANLFDSERLTFFSTAVDQIAARTPATRPDALSVGVVYHTELGSLDTALNCASALVDAERQAASVVGFSRALRYFSVPLRVIGAWDRATEIGVEAFEAATANRLVEETAAAADIIAWTRFQLGDVEDAAAWLRQAKLWIDRLPSGYLLTSASTLSAMIEVDNGQPEAATEALRLPLELLIREPVIRQRMYYLALYARIAVLKGAKDIARTCVEHLRAQLTIARAFRRNEYFLGALVRAIRMIESDEAARAALAEYSRGVPDPGVAQSRYLLEALDAA